MSELYMMVTITSRKYMPAFMDFYRSHQVEVGNVSLGMGTASSSAVLPSAWEPRRMRS